MSRRNIGLALVGGVIVWTLLWSGQAGAGSTGKTGASNKPSKGAAVDGKPSPKEKPKPATQEVTVEQIRLTLQHYVEKLVEGKVSEVQVHLLNLTEPVTVPDGLLEVRVAGRDLDEGLGRRIFQMALTVDGTTIQTLKIMADVSATAEVVTAARYIKPEETLKAEDLKVARTSLSALVHDFATDPEVVIGKRVAKPLRPDVPIRMSALSIPFLVKRGDLVTIEVKHGGLFIQASGTTKANGQLGQFITVTNLDSGKEIRGKVVGPGVVQVGF